GIKLGVSDYAYLTFQADHSRQGLFTETMAGGMYGLKIGPDPDNPNYTLHAGSFIRLNDALIPVIKLDYFPFSVTFSYDVNISKYSTSTYGRGGFEISISYSGFRKNTPEYVLCPRF
ncbi:MAG: type IX secretion system membrane protein PorP/SprF, partial [Chitinophagaceae bacterium]|nr:type IX secretion system membrane protein PorP/SprF [Chitinophagaceae bacterium]